MAILRHKLKKGRTEMIKSEEIEIESYRQVNFKITSNIYNIR
jgi:hypothetical protein